MLKSSKGHEFKAKLGSVRFHSLKAVVCMYARSPKKIIFRVLFGLKNQFERATTFEVERRCFFLRAWSFVSECAEAAFFLKLRRKTLIFFIDLRRIRLFELKGN